jgi:uncharacterized YigZ family protein
MRDYRTVKDISTAEYSEKRSRFIAKVYPCSSEQQAAELLAAARSEYWDAKHNVYAYVLKDGTSRFSDDSEPHGTAGKPVLDVINGNGLEDVLIIVTRYFGGVLLGTGGLVRAYSTSARDAVEASEKVGMCVCSHMAVECEYSDYSVLLTLIEASSGSIKNTEYTDKITVEFCLKNGDVEAFCSNLTETFSSRLEAKKIKEDYFSFKIEEF